MYKENSLTWLESPCNVCGSAGGRLLFEGPDLMMNLPGHFQLIICDRCGLIRQNPRLSWDSLNNYYPDDYNSYDKIIDQETSNLHRVGRRYGMWKRLRSIERLQQGGHLLDIGCGTGIFLREAQRSGHWESVGVEPTPNAASYAQKSLGVTILVDRFDKVTLPDGYFDVVTMWNVLEHMDSPKGDLVHAYKLLRPGGWLVLSIPNVDGISAKLFGRYWMGWDLPRHLYLFSQKQLRIILEDIGFKWEDNRCLAGSHSSLELSFEFLFRGKNLENNLTHFMIQIYRTLPVQIALGPLFWMVDQLRQSSLVTIFVQKKIAASTRD